MKKSSKKPKLPKEAKEQVEISDKRYMAWIEEFSRTLTDEIVDQIVLGEIVRRKSAGKKQSE